MVAPEMSKVMFEAPPFALTATITYFPLPL
jgi:hypothetical protein